MTDLHRRDFLRGALGAAAGAALIPSSVRGLVAAARRGLAAEGGHASPLLVAGPGEGGYGELVEETGIVALPEGFRLRAFGAIGERMSDGNVTPLALDGMAAFPDPAGDGRVRLLRNHEDRNGPTGRTIAGENAYDPAAGGGVVTLVVDRCRSLVRDFVSLNGTAVNCAGGPTPWGSWISCEETVVGTSEGFGKPHGYVFEVPAEAEGPVEPHRIREMGRFSHEAVAVDPSTGVVYLTEDNGFEEGDPYRPGSGFYRYLPESPGRLQEGGRLQMARVRGEPGLQLFRGTEIGISVGAGIEVEWVDIDEPDPDPGDDLPEGERLVSVFRQGAERGAAVFSRPEGCWFGDGSVFFHDTEGGPVFGGGRRGQVWQYVPSPREGQPGEADEPGSFVFVFESPGPEILDGPDNITVSPRGGIVICEDGDGTQHLRGLTPEGRIFELARNTLNGSELAGATFSPDGRTLFVNIQGPTHGTPEECAGKGRTLAVWGPWERGAL